MAFFKQVLKKDSGVVLVESCEVAVSFMSRFKGLLGRDALAENHGLWLEPCNSIHMFFMKFSIDAIYLNKNYSVIKIFENVKPWHFHWPLFEAQAVLELPVGAAKKFRIGDQLCLN